MCLSRKVRERRIRGTRSDVRKREGSWYVERLKRIGGVTSRYAIIHSLCAKTSTWAAVYRHQSTHLHTDLLRHPQRPAHRTYSAMNTSLQTDTQRNILAKAKVFISNLKTMYSKTNKNGTLAGMTDCTFISFCLHQTSGASHFVLTRSSGCSTIFSKCLK